MSLVNEIKQELFTLKGIGVTVVTNLILIGLAAAWILINVNFLGNDVALNLAPDIPIKAGRR